MDEKNIDLNNLAQCCKLSVSRCSTFAEAASYCLELQKHSPGTRLRIEGDFKEWATLTWKKLAIDISDSWLDPEEAVENGACALTIRCIWELTNYQVRKRSWKTTGFDFWVGEKNDQRLFQNKAILEVSGILRGSRAQVNFRAKEKFEQTAPSHHLQVPVFVVVAEFSRPLVKIIHHEK